MNKYKPAFVALIAALNVGCVSYFHAIVIESDAVSGLALKAWLTGGKQEGIALEISGSDDRTRFIDWTRATLELPRFGKRNVSVRPEHEFSVIDKTESVFHLLPQGAYAHSENRSGTRREVLFTDEQLSDDVKPDTVTLSVFICEESPQDDNACAAGAAGWKRKEFLISIEFGDKGEMK